MTSPHLLHHLLELGVAAEHNKVAVIDGDRAVSYGELATMAAGCARRLRASGLSRGGRVALFLPKSIEECACIFGVSQAGGIVVPINPLLKSVQVRHIVNDCTARIVLTTRALRATVETALAGVKGTEIIVVDDEDFRTTPDDEAIPSATAIGEDLAAILYTSGSTGQPKGVMLTHANLVAGTRIVRTYLKIGPDERILSVLPFSFDYGLNQLLTAVEQGATIVLLTFRFGDDVAKAIHRHAITGLAGVPTLWSILTRAAPLLRRDPPRTLRYITNSGGAVPSETVRQLRELLPHTSIFLMYGLTEAFRSTYLPPEELDRRPTSIGKAIPECEVFPVRPDGTRAAPGEPGILVHRGPTVSRGYWNRPDDTARVLRPNPLAATERGADIVCYSGDLVVEDEDGFLYFVGRDDAMIKSSGFRISPTEVEDALMATGAFRQVAVIGLPDETAGQRVHAIGVASNATIDSAAVLKAASERLASYMIPREIELVSALPVTPNGKVDYKLLARERANHGH